MFAQREPNPAQSLAQHLRERDPASFARRPRQAKRREERKRRARAWLPNRPDVEKSACAGSDVHWA